MLLGGRRLLLHLPEINVQVTVRALGFDGGVVYGAVAVMRRLLLLLVVLATTGPAVHATSRNQQSIIARWTGEKICALGVDAFYSLPEPELKALFERDTSMRYDDIPEVPNEQERARITGQLTGYLMAACPQELENYKNR